MDDKEKLFVNDLLEASLRNYAAMEPRPGLEGRVVAGVRARQQEARRHTAWVWAAGLAGVAAMVMLLVFHERPRQPAPLPLRANVLAKNSAPTIAGITLAVQPPAKKRVTRQVELARVDWRPQQFPTPRPLSEQERLLVAYVQSLQVAATPEAPKADKKAEQDSEVSPLSITALKIEPLVPDEESGVEK